MEIDFDKLWSTIEEQILPKLDNNNLNNIL